MCELIPYTECRMFMEEAPYNVTEIVEDGFYYPIKCNNVTREETHIKMVTQNMRKYYAKCVGVMSL